MMRPFILCCFYSISQPILFSQAIDDFFNLEKLNSKRQDWNVILSDTSPDNGHLVLHQAKWHMHFFFWRPLTAKYAQEVDRIKTLSTMAQEQLKGNYPEWEDVVNECFVRAIDYVFSGKHYEWSPDQTRQRIETEYKKGFILCPSIYEQLAEYEKSGDSFESFFPRFISAIEIKKEKLNCQSYWNGQAK